MAIVIAHRNRTRLAATLREGRRSPGVGSFPAHVLVSALA